jgi:hypothetical protein
MTVRSTEVGSMRGNKTSVQCTEAGITDLISYQTKGIQCLWNLKSRLINGSKSYPRTVESSSTLPRVPQDSSNVYPNLFNKARNCLQYDRMIHYFASNPILKRAWINAFENDWFSMQILIWTTFIVYRRRADVLASCLVSVIHKQPKKVETTFQTRRMSALLTWNGEACPKSYWYNRL